ncbi:MAG: DUF1294 domain-containing protein [Clostridia bacterium]|nr:DUF1294 domain-containing protein [Clostridia bacterium]
MTYYLIYLALMNLFTFALYAADKHRAKRGAWRVPERALLGFSLLGGAVGGLAAMQYFRHKTRHFYFYAVNVCGILLHAAIIFLLLRAI